MDYYKQTLFIPRVNENDEVIGKVERWEAHEKGILHRGFTVGLLYDGKMVCQHRKHPVFDGFMDLTASSHPFYEGDILQDTVTAVENCLKREWHVAPENLEARPALVGKVIYDSKHGDFIEHEVCHLYIATVKTLPMPDLEFSYGFSLLPLEHLNDPELNPTLRGLAPWVTEMIFKGVLKEL